MRRPIDPRGVGGIGRFRSINVAAIPPTLFESELFGHERGAFTGANVARPGIFVARAEDHLPREYRVYLREGERRELIVAPNAPAQRVPQPALEASPNTEKSTSRSPGKTKPSTDSPSSTKTLGWVLVGTGGAAAILGSVAGVLVLHNKAIVENECDADKSCPSQRGIEAGKAGSTWSTVSTVAFGASVVFSGVGIYFLVRNDDGQRSAGFGAQALVGSTQVVVSGAF